MPSPLVLASSSAPRVTPRPGALPVYVSQGHLVVQAPQLTLQLPDRRTQEQRGFGLTYKRGPHDLKILPLDSALKQARPARRQGVLYLDRGTTFRVFLELAFTLGQNGVGPFVLMTASEGAPRGWEVSPPPGRVRSLVFIRPSGYEVRVGRNYVASGCRSLGMGPAVPLRAGAWDAQGLVACLHGLSEIVSQRSAETGLAQPTVALTADAFVPIQAVVDGLWAISASGLTFGGIQVSHFS